MGRLESVTRGMSTVDAIAMFQGADVPVGPVLDLDAHLAHPQVVANATYEESDHPVVGRHRFARYPVHFVEDMTGSLPCPELDENRVEILSLVNKAGRNPS